MEKTTTLNVFGMDSPIGCWSVTTSVQPSQVVSIDFHGDAPPPGLRMQPEAKLEQRLACMLSRYFKGDRVDFGHVPVALPSSAFLSDVIHALQTIPYGEVRSYQWLAEYLGKPGAARAVGGALGRNPIPILVPCHRVITKAGLLGGFMRGEAGGTAIKSFLLALEGVRFADNGTLLCMAETSAEQPLPLP